MKSAGVVQVCLDDIVGKGVWEGRTTDACFDIPGLESGFGSGCYDSPVLGAQVCLSNAPDDPWFDITGDREPCDTVGIEWESRSLGGDLYDVCVTIHAGGIGGHQTVEYCEPRDLAGEPHPEPSPVFWIRDHYCGQGLPFIQRPPSLIIPKMGISRVIERWRPPRF